MSSTRLSRRCCLTSKPSRIRGSTCRHRSANTTRNTRRGWRWRRRGGSRRNSRYVFKEKCEGHKSPVCESCNWNILWYLWICPRLSCWYHKRRFGLNRIALIVFLIEPCTIQRSQHFWLETTKTLCYKWTFLTFGNNIINARLISLFSSFYYYM